VGEESEGRLLRVVGVEPVLMSDLEEFIEIAALHCYLENDEVFTLYNIPLEVAKAIERLNNPAGEELPNPVNNGRESIYDVLLLLAPKLREIRNSIKRVVIDSYDVSRGVVQRLNTHKDKRGYTKEEDDTESRDIRFSHIQQTHLRD